MKVSLLLLFFLICEEEFGKGIPSFLLLAILCKKYLVYLLIKVAAFAMEDHFMVFSREIAAFYQTGEHLFLLHPFFLLPLDQLNLLSKCHFMLVDVRLKSAMWTLSIKSSGVVKTDQFRALLARDRFCA